jgi:hypothetical protein
MLKSGVDIEPPAWRLCSFDLLGFGMRVLAYGVLSAGATVA